MNDSIQILNKNGDMMAVEGIAHVMISGTSKKYLFYTLNEKVDNDLTKIYIAEASEEQGGANPIEDAEWEDIRKKMVKISHKEELDDVSYLPFGDSPMNVGEAKKLAVTSVAKQAFKDAQATHTISTNQTETPVVNGTPSFFAPTQEGGESVQNPANDNSQNIFANPPTPVSVDANQSTSMDNGSQVQVVESAPEQSQVQGIPATSAQLTENPAVEQNLATNGENSENIITQVEVAQLPQEPQNTVVEQTPAIQEIVVNEPAVETVQQEEKLIENISTAPSANSVVDANIIQVNATEQKEIISDEDALKAIEVIQEYIAQEEAA